ncbi:MAG: hypothetical protein IPJ74_26295, partial [Saprospiraceae bacterium]|nr:hypothetical protein [Saprospiraceae bacterium]
MKYLILISFLFLTILGNAQTIRVPWYEIEAAPDSGYIARSTSIDGDGAWYLPTYREGDTIAVWNPNTRKLEFRTKASILSGIPS